MKKWLIIIGLLLALFIGGYVVVFKLIVPKTAAAFMPVKWQHIPIGQKRVTVHEYLGIPLRKKGNTYQWEQKINDRKRYVLDVTYNDTIAVKYFVAYEVQILGFMQRSEISYDTLR
jgi:hypothetical protein